MNANTKIVVIDASVALKWVFNDEEAVEQAAQILNDHLTGRLAFHVPDLLGYECSNALWAAVRQGCLDENEARTALHAMRQIQFYWHSLPAIWDMAFKISIQHQRSFYDSTYLALAQQLGVWCFTGDRRLYNALGTQLPWLRWVGDYDWVAIPTTSL
ncbi:hypothetical protein HRbin15_00458 [bacterium HR15]|uniref:Hypothetical conserved protein n=1 Tax=uncultured prokaryote TaxID=198431 RepID=H5S9J2_9ZZZZ|nr:hypothetical conserved protein [uncultured prokaryote]GBC91997.1 hypothetical protein HRbin15_00458 [bacterium HR15]